MFVSILQTDTTGSTWKTAFRRTKTLAPFLWPRKSYILQLQVVCSIVLLLLGRVLNLVVPIYSKLIGMFIQYHVKHYPILNIFKHMLFVYIQEKAGQQLWQHSNRGVEKCSSINLRYTFQWRHNTVLRILNI